MFRRAEVVAPHRRKPEEEPAAGEPRPPLPRPNLSGDLDALLHTGPSFPIRVRGYDRLQVDNYVDWAESHIAVLRRQHDELLSRFGVCSAELEISRRLLAQSPKGLALLPISQRVEEILRLAADEATDMTAAAAAEGERIQADARIEADARLRKAHDIKEAAVAASDRLREEAQRDREEARRDREQAAALLERARQEAAELIEQARREAAEVLRDAAAERDRMTQEAAEARARLSEQIGQALEVVAATVPGERIVFRDNVAQLT